ncbi:hypothetical protein Bca52824_052725 [Brassica carinata]|uniref:Uncharacterized protein n=1 Tax=Brassica carinata TaxID=52824 RepID=A0A8X7UJ05_BRACI|nr:hypothetical protein Bca52824_052725 [Brassica carinata]
MGNAQRKGNEKKKKMKGGVSSEAEPPTKKQKKVKTHNESGDAAAKKDSSEKEGSKDLELENKATLATIVNRNRPLMDQKTIDDRVNALLEERLKVLGVGKIPENNDNPSPPSVDKSLLLASLVVQTQQKSVNSPALAATPGKVFGPKKNLAKELDKESWVKRILDEEFGSVAKATDLDSQPLDFVLISPAKATNNDKDAKRDREQSTANRENLPLLYHGPGELLDTTSTIWCKFLSDLSLVIPSILAEGWVHDWPTYRAIPDHFKERWFLQLANAISFRQASVDVNKSLA